jgi:hypothetical protein
MHNRDRVWLAATAWSIGLGALLCDHFQPSSRVSTGVRALFAVVTCGAICLVLIDKARALGEVAQPQLYQFTRLVSRWVYILLYLLALARMAIYLYEASGYCMLCSAHEAIGPVRPLDDFQLYVGCCLVSLWSARVLVLAVPFKGRQAVHAPTGSQRKQRGALASPTLASQAGIPRRRARISHWITRS